MPQKLLPNHIGRDIIQQALESRVATVNELRRVKFAAATKYKITTPSNVQLLAAYKAVIDAGEAEPNSVFFNLLKRRHIRTLSGVAPVALLTKPFGCPAECIFCPTERNVPKSYLSNEPAVMRAIMNHYDPARQIRMRLQTYEAMGHATDKIELIVIGGTFSHLSKPYVQSYVRACFNALNEPLPAQRKLEDAQKLNETAKRRCVSLSFETRPDWITRDDLRRFRRLGCTKVEIGVQSTDDAVLKLVKRGHGSKETFEATRLLKDAGFKVCYHMMPNLPGATPERDVQMFKEIFENSLYRPDYMKIYPCMVVPYSELKNWWEEGKFRPYTDGELIDLLLKAKAYIPEYTRVIRVIRDIPSTTILGGSKVSNLRQVLNDVVQKRGVQWPCRCIRCREVREGTMTDTAKLHLKVQEYDASQGKDFFMTFEDPYTDKLHALLRLRFPSTNRPIFRCLQDAALIREIHTYGKLLPVSIRDASVSQHRGLGRRLMEAAEKRAAKAGYKKIAVISAVGTREYYRKLGYKLEETYMLKKL